MRIKLKYLVAVWVVIVSLTLCGLVDSVSAYTRSVIRYSDLSWSSYHAYHCIKMWDDETDEMVIYMSKLNATLKQAQKNRTWAKRTAKRLKLSRLSPRKRMNRICDFVGYHWSYDRTQTWVEQAIKTHRANCSAYADLVYILCKASGLPVRYYIGWVDLGTKSGWHCWNRVKVKKTWYWVDTTLGNFPKKKLWSTHSRIVECW